MRRTQPEGKFMQNVLNLVCTCTSKRWRNLRCNRCRRHSSNHRKQMSTPIDGLLRQHCPTSLACFLSVLSLSCRPIFCSMKKRKKDTKRQQKFNRLWKSFVNFSLMTCFSRCNFVRPAFDTALTTAVAYRFASFGEPLVRLHGTLLMAVTTEADRRCRDTYNYNSWKSFFRHQHRPTPNFSPAGFN